MKSVASTCKLSQASSIVDIVKNHLLTYGDVDELEFELLPNQDEPICPLS